MLLVYCPICMARAPIDPDTTPDPECYRCRGEGYVKARPEEMRAHWARASRETPR